MNLYELQINIDSLVDQETGEIIDIDALNALELERDTKISNIACWIKDLKAEGEALKAEEQSLNHRRKVCENKMESLKTYLATFLNGEKFKDSRCSISYRRSEKVTFADDFVVDSLPDEMKKITIEPRKTEIKEFLKGGGEIEGVRIEENTSMTIK
jgi:hypothetical protein